MAITSIETYPRILIIDGKNVPLFLSTSGSLALLRWGGPGPSRQQADADAVGAGDRMPGPLQVAKHTAGDAMVSCE